MKKAHFVGIGGIGMSALAQMLKHDGVEVTGSDRSESPVTEMLTKAGISVLTPQKADNIPADAEVVIYSDAVVEGSEGYAERERARELGIPEKSYFQMLGEVSKGKKTIAIAGTHGKTTTTGMTSAILKEVGVSPTAIVGSIMKDFGSNYLPGTSDIFVVEADEYRAHLLELSPTILVINNLEWDHTDFYPTLESMQDTFRKAIEKVPTDGAIVTDPSNSNIAPILASAKAKVIDYTQEKKFEINLEGEFNDMNARAAAAAARATVPTITDEQIQNALKNFHGTWRRFEYKGKTARGAEVYDDYAHHPTAVMVTLKALREKVSGKIIVAFHPHLYSRTRDLLPEFADAFGNADRVLIAPIFAARETNDGSVSSDTLAQLIRAKGIDASALDFDAIEMELREAKTGDTIMTMGAGDIYKIADRLVAST